MARRKDTAPTARRSVSLDGQQIGYLVFGAFIVAGLVFVAGFVLGQRSAPESPRSTLSTYACLEVLDDVPRRTLVDESANALPELRYEQRLTAADGPAAAADPALEALGADRDDLALKGTAPLDEPLPDRLPGAVPLEAGAPTPAAPPEGRFTLQVKTFRGQVEAQSFAQDLGTRGHRAYVQPDDTDKGRRFLVYVGGFSTRDEAEHYRRGFQRAEAIDGTSVREL